MARQHLGWLRLNPVTGGLPMARQHLAWLRLNPVTGGLPMARQHLAWLRLNPVTGGGLKAKALKPSLTPANQSDVSGEFLPGFKFTPSLFQVVQFKYRL